MAKISNPDVEFEDPSGPENPGDTTTINAPKKNKAGQLELDKPSVGNAKQAWGICKQAEQANKARALRSARMQEVYDGEPLVRPADKANAASSWQSNVNFGSMAVMVDRKVQRMIGTINGMTYLSKSSLPASFQDYKRKSETFQSGLTRMFRSWFGSKTFVQKNTQEDVLQGYCAATFLNPEDWQPEFFSADKFYVPEGAGQWAGDLQWFILKKDIMLNEFIRFFEGDEEVAADVGWKVPECIEACVKASIQNQSEDAQTTEYRKFADMIRDGTLGLTYGGSAARVVKVYYLLSREYDNQVSLWIIERETGKLLRFSFKLFKRFEDVVTLFSLQPGNGSLHSSKGVGRTVINGVSAVEKIKNQMVDNAQLASLRVLTTDAAGMSKMAPKVIAPFIILDKGVDLGDSGFNTNTTDLTRLDAFLSLQIEQAAGATAGGALNALNAQEKTATGEKIQAAAEQESADATEARYATQFADLITNIQRIAYSDENIREAKRLFQKVTAGEITDAQMELELSKGLADKEAAKALVEMFQNGLSEDEIKVLRSKNASGLAYLDEAINSAAIRTVAQAYTGDPRIDQQELLYRDVLQMAGPELAKLLVIPGIDQTIIAEATRMQMTETANMIIYAQDLAALVPGVTFEPSPRDNHRVHLEVIKGILGPAGTMISTKPEMATKTVLKTIELHINHANLHIEALLLKDKSPEAKELADWFATFQKTFVEAVQMLEANKVQAERATAAAAEAKSAVTTDAVEAVAEDAAVAEAAPLPESVL